MGVSFKKVFLMLRLLVPILVFLIFLIDSNHGVPNFRFPNRALKPLEEPFQKKQRHFRGGAVRFPRISLKAISSRKRSAEFDVILRKEESGKIDPVANFPYVAHYEGRRQGQKKNRNLKSRKVSRRRFT